MRDLEKVFESDNIIYVKLSKELVDDYLKMINDPGVMSTIVKNAKTYTYEEEIEWINSILEKDGKCYSMIEKETGEFIGNIEITDKGNKVGELGISITPEKQNKHYGTEGMKRMVEYGYSIGYEQLELNVFNTNQRGIKCYENAGFVIDGIGKDPDDYHMSHKTK